MTKGETSDVEELLVRLGEAMTPAKGEQYSEARERLIGARDLFHEAVAKQLESPLNEYLRVVSHSTLDEKRALARQLNSDLRDLNCAIRLPSGDPGSLRGGEGHNPDVGRFELCATRKGKTCIEATTRDMPVLQLMGHQREGGGHHPPANPEAKRCR